MKNKFYGIGVGPGDPELLTLKAYKTLKTMDIIFAPKAEIKTNSLAREIVENIIEEKKKFIEIEFPMTKDYKILREKYINAAEFISQKIDEGYSAAYLTLGDPLLYSTYVYLLNALKEVSPDLIIETIPGISAFSAVASRSGFSLAEKEETVCICTVPEDMEELREKIIKGDTVVIMKVAKRLRKVIGLLKEMNLLKNSIFGSRIGMKGERFMAGISGEFNISEQEGYLSTIIVRKLKPNYSGSL